MSEGRKTTPPPPCPACLHPHEPGIQCGTVDLGGGFTQHCCCEHVPSPEPSP
jgi:hypothetical protein